MVFIDAPYVLPLWYKPSTDPLQDPAQQHPPTAAPAAASFPAGIPKPKRAWLLSQELLQAQPDLQELFSRAQEGAASNPDQPDSHLAQQQEQQQQIEQQQVEQQQPQQRQVEQQEQQPGVWLPAPAHIATHEQYTTQALGWDESWRTIQAALAGAPLLQQQQGEPGNSQQLPAVDGILGFSQGAAVAAVVAALRQQQQQQQAGHARWPSQLKFVLIASGFPSPAVEHQALLQEQAPIALPSLHMFASAAEGGGGDRQIEQQMSEQLLGMFAEDSRRVVMHGGGHMVPTDAASVVDIRAFLQQFL